MLTSKQRIQMRRRQDRFLKLPIVQQFIKDHGSMKPLWEGGPSALMVSVYVYSEWQSVFQSWIQGENR